MHHIYLRLCICYHNYTTDHINYRYAQVVHVEYIHISVRFEQGHYEGYLNSMRWVMNITDPKHLIYEGSMFYFFYNMSSRSIK